MHFELHSWQIVAILATYLFAASAKGTARADALTPRATSGVTALTRIDRTEHDLAALVRSAARPGLKTRIENYRSRVMHTQ